MWCRLPVLAVAAGLASAATAHAADMALESPPVAVAAANEGWIVTLKASGGYMPKTEGASDYGFFAYPGLSLRRPGQPWKFGAPDDGFGIALIDSAWFQFGPVGRVRPKRNSSDVSHFEGLDDVHWAIEPGAFLEVYPLEFFRIRGELRRGVWGHHGFVGNVSADYIQRFDRLIVSFGPRTEIGDGDFMDAYFGISAHEAVENGRVAPYRAKGGVKSVGVAGALTYEWTEHWSTTAFGAYNRLVGEAADSPVAKTLGTKNAYTAGLGVAYSFSVDW